MSAHLKTFFNSLFALNLRKRSAFVFAMRFVLVFARRGGAYSARFFAQTAIMKEKKVIKSEKVKKVEVKTTESKKTELKKRGAKTTAFLLFLRETVVGAMGGFINGFFGGGGGMVIVPMLTHILKYERKQAHASCIAVILPVAATSGAIYAFSGEVNFITLIPVAAGVLIGGIAGALSLKKIKSKTLGYVFCAVTAIAGIKMIF